MPSVMASHCPAMADISDIIYCERCEMWLGSTQWQDHKIGRKHKNNTHKHIEKPFGSMTKRVKITSGVVGPFPPGLILPGQSPINIQNKRNKGKKKKKKKKSNEAKSLAKGLLCAKMLVRSGLRCSCHFVYIEKCPARARSRLLSAQSNSEMLW